MNESTHGMLKHPKKVDPLIADITNRPKLNRSFTGNSTSNVMSSLDLRHPEEHEFERPHKHNPYTSICDSTSNLQIPEETTFMARWNNSVVESIDFKAELQGVDLKETSDALNCAHYAEDVHKHCLKTEMDFHPD